MRGLSDVQIVAITALGVIAWAGIAVAVAIAICLTIKGSRQQRPSDDDVDVLVVPLDDRAPVGDQVAGIERHLASLPSPRRGLHVDELA